MIRLISCLIVVAACIYGAEHRDRVAAAIDAFKASPVVSEVKKSLEEKPEFRVWVSENGPLGAITDSGHQSGWKYVHIQSSDDRKVIVTQISINGKVQTDQSKEFSTGDETSFVITNPVKVTIETSLGNVAYTFR